MLRNFLIIAMLSALTACGSSDGIDRTVPDPKTGPGFVNGHARHPTVKVGRPYTIRGTRYVPKYEPNYSEVGEASWYGPGFHGRSTANGEPYDKYALTAAHKTLPMPSMVRVTNLDNGKSVMVRVNDRGPFAAGRIIDLSKKAAERIDMLGSGVARVKVEYLPEETNHVLSLLEAGKRPSQIDDELENKPIQIVSRSSSFVPLPSKNVPMETVDAANSGSVSSEDLPPPPSVKVASAPSPSVNASSSAGPAPLADAPVYRQSSFDALNASVPPPTPTAPTKAVVATPLPPPTPPLTIQASPTPSVTAQAPPNVPATSVPVKGSVIQLGAFSSEENAKRIASQFKGATIQPVPPDVPSMYRVRLGPFPDRYTAESMLIEAQKTIPEAQLFHL